MAERSVRFHDWGAAGGKPDGWVLYGAPCGHAHGVRPTKVGVLWEVFLCLTRLRRR